MHLRYPDKDHMLIPGGNEVFLKRDRVKMFPKGTSALVRLHSNQVGASFQNVRPKTFLGVGLKNKQLH